MWEEGFRPLDVSEEARLKDSGRVFSGDSLLALQEENFTSLEQLRDAKRLLRLALQPLLGHKPLQSQCFRTIWTG